MLVLRGGFGLMRCPSFSDKSCTSWKSLTGSDQLSTSTWRNPGKSGETWGFIYLNVERVWDGHWESQTRRAAPQFNFEFSLQISASRPDLGVATTTNLGAFPTKRDQISSFSEDRYASDCRWKAIISADRLSSFSPRTLVSMYATRECQGDIYGVFGLSSGYICSAPLLGTFLPGDAPRALNTLSLDRV